MSNKNQDNAQQEQPKEATANTKSTEDSESTQGVAFSAPSAARARRSIANHGRTSILQYEEIELREGRLDPLFRVFWRNRYTFYDEK